MSPANHRDQDLRGANFRNADLRGADFGGASLEGADFRGTDCRGADFGGASLEGADFRGTDCRGADFGGASLEGADFRGANLDGARLRGADLGRALFVGASLVGVNLNKACLAGADMTDADLRDVSMCGANCHDVQFRGAQLAGADFRGANVDTYLMRESRGAYFAEDDWGLIDDDEDYEGTGDGRADELVAAGACRAAVEWVAWRSNYSLAQLVASAPPSWLEWLEKEGLGDLAQPSRRCECTRGCESYGRPGRRGWAIDAASGVLLCPECQAYSVDGDGDVLCAGCGDIPRIYWGAIVAGRSGAAAQQWGRSGDGRVWVRQGNGGGWTVPLPVTGDEVAP